MEQVGIAQPDAHVFIFRGQGVQPLERLDGCGPILIPVIQRDPVEIQQVELFLRIAVVRVHFQHGLKVGRGLFQAV